MNSLTSSPCSAQFDSVFLPQLILEWCERYEQTNRRDRLLPRPVVFTGLLLYAWQGCRNLTHALAQAAHMTGRCAMPIISKGSVTPARQRIPNAMWRDAHQHAVRLTEELALPSPIPGFRVLCLDGTSFATPDTACNLKRWGKPACVINEAPDPMIRVCVMLDAATHQFTAFGYAGFYQAGEGTLGDELIEQQAKPGTLIEMDRGFFSFQRIARIRELGAHALIRVKRDIKLPMLERLPDGSFRSAVRISNRHHKPFSKQRREAPPGTLPDDIPVRVVEYVIIKDGAPVHYRLLTTVLDHAALPAKTMINGYRLRWRVETGIRELKWLTARFRRPHLAGKDARTTEQELLALFTAHAAARLCMAHAAKDHSLDPTRLSLSGSMAILEQCVPKLIGGALDEAELFRAIARCRLPQPSQRTFPRHIKRRRPGYPSRSPTTKPNEKVNL